jgi:hypothetical protein
MKSQRCCALQVPYNFRSWTCSMCLYLKNLADLCATFCYVSDSALVKCKYLIAVPTGMIQLPYEPLISGCS